MLCPRKVCTSKGHFGEKQLGFIIHTQMYKEISIGFSYIIYFAERNLKVFGTEGFL
jgi:hypothetical protein